MDKKIAVPFDNKGKLDSHFGHCKFFDLLFEENGKIKAREKIVPLSHELG